MIGSEISSSKSAYGHCHSDVQHLLQSIAVSAMLESLGQSFFDGVGKSIGKHIMNLLR
jgi:hypothetical protein